GEVVAGRPPEVLQHLAVAGRGQLPDGHDRTRVVGGQHDAGRFDGDIGTRTDGDTHVGARERGRIVDTVADHGDRVTSALQLADGLILLFRQDLGEHFVDAQLVGDGVGNLPRVTGDQRDLHVEPVESVDRRAGLGPNLVLQRQRAEHIVVANDVEDRGPTLFPTLDRRLEVTGNLPAAFPQQGWPADDDPSAVDCGHYAPTSHRSRIGDVSWCDVPLTGGRDDGAGQRVFAFRFDPGCQGQQLLVRDAARG